MEHEKVNYYDVRDRFRVGDIEQWQGAGALSGAISSITGSPSTHISMTLMRIVHSHNRWVIMEADEGAGNGILSAEVDTMFLSEKIAGSDRIKPYNGKCIWRPLIPELDRYRDAIAQAMWDCKGIAYDYSDMVLNITGRRPFSIDDLYCSEMAQFVLNKGIPEPVLWEIMERCTDYREKEAMLFLIELKWGMVPGDFDYLPLLGPGKELRIQF